MATDALQEMIQRTSGDRAKNGICDRSTRHKCPICQDTGLEWIPDGGQGTVRECRCGIRKKQIVNSRLLFANVPESFKEVRMSNFSETIYNGTSSKNKIHTAVKAVNYWLDRFEDMKDQGIGLYLHSTTKGSGKTRMAASIANELIYDKKIQVKFSTSLQILSEIKRTWNDQGTWCNESKTLDFLCTSEILIIDDFGVEQVKSWIQERFYQIVNSRYVDKKITIFTSNASISALKYDDRIISRIKERTFQIPFPEESVRDIIARRNMLELANGIKKGAPMPEKYKERLEDMRNE